MKKKNNIRSIRFSDEIIKMIESQAGETFTAKFEALVTRCMWELPKKEEELKALEETILKRRKQLSEMTVKIDSFNRQLRSMEYSLNQLKDNISRTQQLEW